MRNIDIDEVKSEILELEIIQESNENKLEQEETELGKLPLMVFMSVVFVIFIVILVAFTWKDNTIFDFNSPINSEKIGHFGDIIAGLIGTTMTSIGIFFVYKSLNLQRREFTLQRRELTLQRREFELTRYEITSHKEEVVVQTKLYKIDQFENKFFKLLEFHKLNVNSISVLIGKNRLLGEEFFEYVSLNITKEFNLNRGNIQDSKDLLLIVFNDYYHKHKSELGHYFRNLYHLISFVDRAEILEKSDKINYIKLLRAQFTNYEIVLLAYNALSKQGEGFYKYMNEYELIKNIDFELYETDNNKKGVACIDTILKDYPYLNKVYDEQKNIFNEEK